MMRPPKLATPSTPICVVGGEAVDGAEIGASNPAGSFEGTRPDGVTVGRMAAVKLAQKPTPGTVGTRQVTAYTGSDLGVPQGLKRLRRRRHRSIVLRHLQLRMRTSSGIDAVVMHVFGGEGLRLFGEVAVP